VAVLTKLIAADGSERGPTVPSAAKAATWIRTDSPAMPEIVTTRLLAPLDATGVAEKLPPLRAS